MTRPLLVTKYRGTGVTQCEVFQNSGGTLVSLFTYGTGGLATDEDFKPGSLATHWAGYIYAISPEQGIYRNTPPSETATLYHSFTSPNTGAASFCMDWQTVLKDGKTQLFTLYHTSVTNQIRMVFIDEDGVVTETANIAVPAPAAGISYTRGLNFGNKIYTSSQTSNYVDVQITDPEAENAIEIQVIDGSTMTQSDIAAHSGNLYLFSNRSTTIAGLGNALWSLDSAMPYKLIEWNRDHLPAPNIDGQCCIFSDGDDLILVAGGSGLGTNSNEFDVWKVDFDGNGVPQGVTSVRDTTFGFDNMALSSYFRCYASRDIESSTGQIETNLHIVTTNGSIQGVPIHHYKWNGADSLAEYLGVGGDSFMFDSPSWRLGGGGRTFTNQDELDFIVTDIAPTDSDIDITYLITGSARSEGVAMQVMFNNQKDSPITPATVSPMVNGVSSGVYIAGISTNASGVFRWDIAADGVGPNDVPNISAALIRI